MDSFTVWLTGTGAATTSIVAAVVMYALYSWQRARLPLATKEKGLESRVFELEEQKRHLEQEVADLNTRKAEYNSISAELELAKKTLAETQENIAKLEPMRAEYEKRNNELSEVKTEVDKAMAAWLEAEEKTRAAREEFESLVRQKDEVLHRRDDLHREVQNLERTRNALNNQIATLNGERAELTSRLDAVRSELIHLHEQLKQARQELREIERQKREAESEREAARIAMEGYKREADSLQAEIHRKGKEIERLGEALANLTAQVGTFGDAMNPPPQEERLGDFHNNVLVLDKVGLDARELDERECLEHVHRHLQQQGFTFTERTLCAFHTGLKTADISPLVVLAGISGTGKSQLPRLYAEAMGMHFLNVAVQPRWDSPQDLLGFYNYMEHRYKATELSCALRQMDARNWEAENVDEQAVQAGMLMVLMDEMNLARIEYYFSELISKLEMRNAIERGVGTEANSRLAEILIESGPLGGDEKHKYLYVGRNVLFVGTMNEDETTQSLSDKVLDRANVLRFGKPSKTTADTRANQNMEANGYLSNADWRQWCSNDLEDHDAEHLAEICSKLNRAMAQIERPFGHRLHQAMYRYIACYPKWMDDRFDLALADQLEQKIIPKLRGVSRGTHESADDAFRAIRDIVEQTGDEELSGAFEAAIRGDEFRWTGVNREA